MTANTERINIHISKALKDRIAIMRERTGVSEAAAVRLLLGEALDARGITIKSR